VVSLFVIEGRDYGKRYELDGSSQTLGRVSSNEIQLHDTEVSRQHAQVSRVDGQFTIVDLESSNGTFVNSDPIEQHVLQTGDKVQLGQTLMLYTGPGDQSSDNIDEIINIVGQSGTDDGSRIVQTISQEEGSQFLSGDDIPQSPWLARARSNLQIMYRTALAVSHTLDINQLLNRIMELIFEWVDADRGCIMLLDRDTEELVPKVHQAKKTTSRAAPKSDKITISHTILDYVMERKEGVLTTDAREDQRWDPAASIVEQGVREAICVPMQGRYGIVGVIYIDTYTPAGRMLPQRASHKFTEEHLKLMVAIGHQAALAVEDTAYYSAMVQSERLAAVGQTIATLSHHIKNILQGIRGGSYLIEEGLKNEKTDLVRKGWSIVDRNQERISNLVMDMLTFSKEREPEPVAGDMNAIVSEVVELMQTRADEKRVALGWQPSKEMPTLTFDPEGIHRAVLNVVTNAIDACIDSDSGQVDIYTRFHAQKNIVSIDVHDNGSGIDPEAIKSIFTVFESHKGGRGTGLGLPVSQKILREHGGDVHVTSTPGQGSIFSLQLPAIRPSDSSIAERPR